jgi:transmembrane sensor
VSEVIKLPSLRDVEEEAAAWVWRLDSESVSDAGRRDFETWIRRDPRNGPAFAQLGGVWRQLDDLAEAKRPEKIATFADPGVKRAPRRTLIWALAIAASVVVGIGVYLILPHESLESVATAVGQQRSITLRDESEVTLNTNSIVETRLAANVRDVYLRKGEAYFAVAHDRARPFLVHAGDAVVRAVGTAFDVRVRDAAHVEVIVSEGRVEVQIAQLQADDALTPRRANSRAAPRFVDAGERLRSGPGEVIVQPVSAGDLASSMAWRQGAVVFDGQSLTEAAAELSRYTDTRFVVTDPRIKELPVGGRFRTDDVDGFLFALETALPVVIRHAPNGLVYIDPRS